MRSQLLRMDIVELAKYPTVRHFGQRVRYLPPVHRFQLMHMAASTTERELLTRVQLTRMEWAEVEQRIHHRLGLDAFVTLSREERSHLAAAAYVSAYYAQRPTRGRKP